MNQASFNVGDKVANNPEVQTPFVGTATIVATRIRHDVLCYVVELPNRIQVDAVEDELVLVD